MSSQNKTDEFDVKDSQLYFYDAILRIFNAFFRSIDDIKTPDDEEKNNYFLVYEAPLAASKEQVCYLNNEHWPVILGVREQISKFDHMLLPLNDARAHYSGGDLAAITIESTNNALNDVARRIYKDALDFSFNNFSERFSGSRHYPGKLGTEVAVKLWEILEPRVESVINKVAEDIKAERHGKPEESQVKSMKRSM